MKRPRRRAPRPSSGSAAQDSFARVVASQARRRLRTKSPSLRSGLLRLPEDLGDLVDLGQQLVGLARVELALGTTGAGQLGGLVDELVELRVLLEVRGLEVVGPQHPQVVLDELGALVLDQDRAGAEVGIVVVRDLRDDGLDRLRLDARLSGVVHAAGQVAVRGYLDRGGEQELQHAVFPLTWTGGSDARGSSSQLDCDTTPGEERRSTRSRRRAEGDVADRPGCGPGTLDDPLFARRGPPPRCPRRRAATRAAFP